jgi:hypothetical protein
VIGQVVGREHLIRRAAVVALIGLAAWLVLWSSVRPRAGYDTLWYSMYTYQYAGASFHESLERSWDLVTTYADPRLVATLHRNADGDWWGGWNNPTRQRWVGIYKMRPVMPLVGAISFPILGTAAPVTASVLAVVTLTLVAWLALGPLVGWLGTAFFLLLSYANPLFSHWLINMTTDGLGIALFFGALACLARYAESGRGRWLASGMAFALVLAFTRQSGAVLPIVFAVCAAASLLARRGPARRFALAAVASAVPLILFAGYAAAAGLPSFADQLQDVPTLHFTKPDVPDPVGFLIGRNLALAARLIHTFRTQPVLWGTLTLALVGYAFVRTWWTAPFIVALGAVLLLQAAHPVLTEVDRTLSPSWLSLHLGVSLLAALAARLVVSRGWVLVGAARAP